MASVIPIPPDMSLLESMLDATTPLVNLRLAAQSVLLTMSPPSGTRKSLTKKVLDYSFERPSANLYTRALKMLTVPEIKKVLKDHNLSISGNRQALVLRVYCHDESIRSASTAPEHTPYQIVPKRAMERMNKKIDKKFAIMTRLAARKATSKKIIKALYAVCNVHGAGKLTIAEIRCKVAMSAGMSLDKGHARNFFEKQLQKVMSSSQATVKKRSRAKQAPPVFVDAKALGGNPLEEFRERECMLAEDRQ